MAFFTYFSRSSITLDWMTSNSLRNFSSLILTALSVSKTDEEAEDAMESRCNIDLDSTFSVVSPNTQPKMKKKLSEI